MQAERKKPNKRQRRRNRRTRVVTVEQLMSKPSTDEFQVARWVKTYCKMRNSTILNNPVQYFIGNNLVDLLLDSKFAMGDCALFTDHEEVGDFLHLMLVHNFFYRAERDDSEKSKKTKKGYQPALRSHPEQTFVDAPGELYVWTYEPLYLGNWSALFLLYFSLTIIHTVNFWPEDLEKTPRNTYLVASTLFFKYLVMTFSRLGLYHFVRWITNHNYEFLILPNLCKIVPFHKSLWPLCHIKYIGVQNINKSNSSIFNIFDFYHISVGAFVVLILTHLFVCFYVLYKFLLEKLLMTN